MVAVSIVLSKFACVVANVIPSKQSEPAYPEVHLLLVSYASGASTCRRLVCTEGERYGSAYARFFVSTNDRVVSSISLKHLPIRLGFLSYYSLLV